MTAFTLIPLFIVTKKTKNILNQFSVAYGAKIYNQKLECESIYNIA